MKGKLISWDVVKLFFWYAKDEKLSRQCFLVSFSFSVLQCPCFRNLSFINLIFFQCFHTKKNEQQQILQWEGWEHGKFNEPKCKCFEYFWPFFLYFFYLGSYHFSKCFSSCNYNTNRTNITFCKVLLNLAYLWSRARFVINKKQSYFSLPDNQLAVNLILIFCFCESKKKG